MKIDFEFQTKYGKYSDAIHLADDHSFSAEEIEAIKQERLNAWITIIENPVFVEEIQEE